MLNCSISNLWLLPPPPQCNFKKKETGEKAHGKEKVANQENHSDSSKRLKSDESDSFWGKSSETYEKVSDF